MKYIIQKSINRCEEMGISKDISKPLIELDEKLIMNKNKSVLIHVFNEEVRKIQVKSTNDFIFFLTDNEGVILDFTPKQMAKNIHIGMSFSEKSCGTNAIALAMEEKRTIELKKEMHYCNMLKKWHCLATPIFLNNDIIGYLDISSINEELREELKLITDLLPYKITKVLKDRLDTEYKDQREDLCDTQVRVLKGLAKGYTVKHIALDLKLSENTIKYHKKKIFESLDVQSSSEAVMKGMKLGIIKGNDIV